MQRGQVAVGVAGDGGYGQGEPVVVAEATARVGLGSGFSAGAQAGRYHGSGGPQLRDARVGVGWRAVDQAQVSLELRPGVSLPLGSASADGWVPRSTASVDPVLSASFYAGDQWLMAVDTDAQVPVVAGSDGLRQGPYTSVVLRGARRLPNAVASAGVNDTRRGPGDDGVGYHEVAAVAGLSWTPLEGLGVAPRVRAPFWSDQAKLAYRLAVGLELTWVSPRKEDDHSE